MEILEERYGLVGYSFWFKLLERLGDTEGHYLDCTNPITWEYLQTKTRQDAETCHEMLTLLSTLGAIDQELWRDHSVVWCQNFVENIADAYRNRKVDIPAKPNFLRKKLPPSDISDTKKPQRRGEEIIGEEISREGEGVQGEGEKKPPKKTKKPSNSKVPLPPDFAITPDLESWAKAQGFTHLEEHLEWMKDWATANAKKYLDWKAVFRNAVRGNWGRIDHARPERRPKKDPERLCKCGSGKFAVKCCELEDIPM